MVLLKWLHVLAMGIHENPISELMKHEKGICALCSEETPGVMTVPRKQ